MLSKPDAAFDGLCVARLRGSTEKETLQYMSFGEFKAYVACKVLGHAQPELYNVMPLDRQVVVGSLPFLLLPNI